MKKIASFNIGILIGCIAISAGATSLSSIHSFKVSSPIKSKDWSLPSRAVVKQPGGTVLKGQNGYGVSMDECRTEINETRRESQDCETTLGTSERTSTTYTDFISCNMQSQDLRRTLSECLAEHDHLESSGTQRSGGSSDFFRNFVSTSSDSTKVTVHWDDPECNAPESSALRETCLGDCRRALDMVVYSRHWCQEIASDPEAHFTQWLSQCQDYNAIIQRELDENGCANGTVVTPTAGVGTCGATGCR